MIAKSDPKKVIQKSERKKSSKHVIEISSFMSEGEGRGGGERGAAKNKKVIEIIFSTGHTEKK